MDIEADLNGILNLLRHHIEIRNRYELVRGVVPDESKFMWLFLQIMDETGASRLFHRQ